MINEAGNTESIKKICGIVAFLGVAANAVALFTLVRYAFRGESPYSLNFLLKNLALIACYTMVGVGALTDRHDLFKTGLFVGAATFALDAYFPLLWISEDTKYYESLAKGLGNGYFFLLVSYLAAIVGFALMGILFSQKREWQFPNMGLVATVCIAMYIVLTLGYAIYFTHEQYVSFGPYLTSYITGSSALSIVGAVGVMLMPFAFPEEAAISEAPAIAGSAQNTTINVTPVPDMESQPVLADGAFSLLRKYKQLLDMDVITQEEFEAKKKELLR